MAKQRKRKKPKRKPLPPGYGEMDTSGMEAAAGTAANYTAGGAAIGAGLGAGASAFGTFGALAPVLIPAGAKLGAMVGGQLGAAQEAEAEAAFAAEQAAKDAAFAMQQFEYQQARDEYEYDEAVYRQNLANATKDTPRLESMNIIPQFRRGR